MILQMSGKKHIFLRFIAKPLYKFFYLNPRVKIIKEDNGVLDKIEGPAIIVGNHSHSLDPIFAYASMRPHVRWVAGAYLFKNKFTNFVIGNLATCIPKQQGRSDLTTIRRINKALKDGSIVGLFPEGTRTWDGNSLNINNEATAKLLRIFKVPVYFLSFEGAYDLHPRWADYKRRGLLIIKLKKVLTAEELKNSSLEQLIQITKENLYFNQQEWQDKAQLAYVGKKNAHGIQRLLYICPKCNSVQTIYGRRNKVICSHCHTEDLLTEYTNFKEGNFGYKTLPDWNEFQKEYIEEHQLTYKKDQGDFFRKGVDNSHFEMISTNFTCLLDKNNIIFSLSDNQEYIFEIDKIESMVLSVKQSIEFYYDNHLFSFRLQPKLNSYKYFQKWEVLNNA